MKKIIFRVSLANLSKAVTVAQTFERFYNTPKWDKAKIKFDKAFSVHETKAGTIVVNEL